MKISVAKRRARVLELLLIPEVTILELDCYVNNTDMSIFYYEYEHVNVIGPVFRLGIYSVTRDTLFLYSDFDTKPDRTQLDHCADVIISNSMEAAIIAWNHEAIYYNKLGVDLSKNHNPSWTGHIEQACLNAKNILLRRHYSVPLAPSLVVIKQEVITFTTDLSMFLFTAINPEEDPPIWKYYTMAKGLNDVDFAINGPDDSPPIVLGLDIEFPGDRKINPSNTVLQDEPPTRYS